MSKPLADNNKNNIISTIIISKQNIGIIDLRFGTKWATFNNIGIKFT